MKYLARKGLERAIKNLKTTLTPKSKKVSEETDKKQVINLLHSTKNEIDLVIQDLNGSTSIQWTDAHAETEKMADQLLEDYFTKGDFESIKALASGLIAQLTRTQAEEHYEAFEEQYKAYVKGE